MKKQFLCVTVGSIALALLGGCGDDGKQINRAPIAALRLAVLARVNVPVEFDASDSVDPDGDALIYEFEIVSSPSVAQSEAVMTYTFSDPGQYTVAVRVTDEAGLTDEAMHTLTIRAEWPAEPDFCDCPDAKESCVNSTEPNRALVCQIGNECDGGVCYHTGSGQP